MNNKASKRASKKTSALAEDTENGGNADDSFKSDSEELKGFSVSEINANAKPIPDDLDEQNPEEGKRLMVTRSQNATPQPKKSEEPSEEIAETNGVSEQTKENGEHSIITNGVETKESHEAVITESKETTNEVLVTEQIELEPLADEPDEPEPELQFDENSDLESGKNSPAVSRCTTRRSQIRNVPTPRTPRLIAPEQKEAETFEIKEPVEVEPEVEAEVLQSSQTVNDSLESINSEDVSTFVAVGSDATRINFMQERTFDGEVYSPFLKSLKEGKNNSSLHRLSTRRSIRSVSRVSLLHTYSMLKHFSNV